MRPGHHRNYTTLTDVTNGKLIKIERAQLGLLLACEGVGIPRSDGFNRHLDLGQRKMHEARRKIQNSTPDFRRPRRDA
jgi:hypothetical protein